MDFISLILLGRRTILNIDNQKRMVISRKLEVQEIQMKYKITEAYMQ